MASCPANVFNKYSNVFAQITKNFIGEIQQDSDSECESMIGDLLRVENENKIVEQARKALIEINLNGASSVTKTGSYKFNNASQIAHSNDISSITNTRPENNPTFDNFFEKFNTDLAQEKQNVQSD